MLRLSTNQLFRMGIDSMLDNQARLSKTQLQLSTGKRIISPSDDPSGAVQSLELRRAIETTEQYRRNGDQAYSRLRLEESALANVIDTLQRVRELAIRANNDTADSETRAGLAVEIGQRLDEIFGLANTKDSNDEYIFAGYRSQGQPFVRDAGGGFTYAGDAGQRALQISSVRKVTIGDSGRDAFFSVPSGNGTFATSAAAGNGGSGVIDVGSVSDASAWVPDIYTISFTSATTYDILDGGGATIASGAYQSGASISFNGIAVNVTGAPASGDSFTVEASSPTDVFSIVQNLETMLATPTTNPAENAQLRTQVNRSLDEVDQAMQHILNVRASIGARMNAIETQQQIHEGALVNLKDTLSGVEDLDYAEAISRFNQQLVSLQAAQQSYVKVQGLSLFNYIG